MVLFPDPRVEGEIRSAILSPDGKLRYTLTRWWGDGEPGPARLLPWIGLNPSTADATQDDATIRRIRGFTRAAGYPGFVMLNLWAYRAQDPKDLHAVVKAHGIWRSNRAVLPDQEEPLDPVNENDRYVLHHVDSAGCAVLAWGAWPYALTGPQAMYRKSRANLMLWLLQGKRRLYLQAPGKPRPTSPPHPLYLPTSCTLEAW